jgi:hypothetical protein
MAAKPINVSAAPLVLAASTVGDHVERAAQPGPVPTGAASASPADAAAATVAAAMRTKINAMSAELAGKGTQLQATGQAAAEALQAKDAENSARSGRCLRICGETADDRRAGSKPSTTPGNKTMAHSLRLSLVSSTSTSSN